MKEQHPSWKGIVPCFESGREYLDWIKDIFAQEGTYDPKYRYYFWRLSGSVSKYSYDAPIDEEEMCAALERSQITGEMIDLEPDDEFLPGGEREGQLDGWEYHIVFRSKEDFSKKYPTIIDNSFTDSYGSVYKSHEAYYNSPDLDTNEVMLYLHAGKRKPQNDFERHLLEEMKDIEANGGIIDFSENI